MIETPQPPIIQTFTCHMEHIAMMADLQERGVVKNKSALIRQALEEFYARHQADQPEDADNKNAA